MLDGPRLRRIVIACLALVLLGFLALALKVHRMPDLSPWHELTLENRFRASDAGGDFDFSDYLVNEEKLFQELEDRLVSTIPNTPDNAWCRYSAGGVTNPSHFPVNWNRTTELRPTEPVGTALLLHGLTDSPYSLRAVAEILFGEGYHVVALRLPGHGINSGALTTARLRDWRAAVDLGARHLETEVGSGRPFLLVGYSNGAALALDYTFRALDEDLPRPHRLVLFSPQIAVSPFAPLASLHQAVSWIPGLERLRWIDIIPEFDPYKYNSFPKNAGRQAYLLTRDIQRSLDRLIREDRVGEVPPMLSFASLADATVRVEAVVDSLYDRIRDPRSELVIFDVNRGAAVLPFLAINHIDRLQALTARTDLPYRLTVVGNLEPSSSAVVVRTWAPGASHPEVENLGVEWPPGVYSLSHVAIPFPPGDPIYGSEPVTAVGTTVPSLGTLEPRGEKKLLRIPAGWFDRLRSNPFFNYVEDRLLEVSR